MNKMNRDSTINDIMKVAGKENNHQQVRFVNVIDGIECFGETGSVNDILYVFTYDTAELQKKIDGEQNEQRRDYLIDDLERATRIKEDWLNSHA